MARVLKSLTTGCGLKGSPTGAATPPDISAGRAADCPRRGHAAGQDGGGAGRPGGAGCWGADAGRRRRGGRRCWAYRRPAFSPSSTPSCARWTPGGGGVFWPVPARRPGHPRYRVPGQGGRIGSDCGAVPAKARMNTLHDLAVATERCAEEPVNLEEMKQRPEEDGTRG